MENTIKHDAPASNTASHSDNRVGVKREDHQTTEPTKLDIAACIRGVTSPKVKPLSLTWSELTGRLNSPVEGKKDGPYFIRCQCKDDYRKEDNAQLGYLAILDGDSRIDTDTGEILSGAPDPQEVHKVLAELGLTHAIYSSHSNRSDLNKYRVVLPVEIADKEELAGIVDWLIHQLHKQDVYLNPVAENYGFTQPWYLPRYDCDDAKNSFVFLEHDGGEFPKSEAIAWAEKSKPKVVIPKVSDVSRVDPDSPIGRFNLEHDVEWMLTYLTEHGYRYDSCGSSMNDAPTFRLEAPKSSSREAGVNVFKTDKGVWRVYSHHGEHDPLSHVAEDAFGVYTALGFDGDSKAALESLEPEKEVFEFNTDAAKLDFKELFNFDNPPEAPPFIIEGMLPQSAFCIAGAGGSGKSSWLLKLMVHIIIGRPLLDMEINIPGKCVLITAEDEKPLVEYRLHHIVKAMDLSKLELRKIGVNLIIEDVSGEMLRLVGMDGKGNIEATDTAKAIIEAYRGQGVSMMLFDPMNFFSAGERILNDGEAAAMQVARRISKEVGCATGFIHHVGQQAAREGIVDQYASRGGTALADNSRMMGVMARHTQTGNKSYTIPEAIRNGMEAIEDGRLVRLHVPKVSWAAPFKKPIWIERDDVNPWLFREHWGYLESEDKQLREQREADRKEEQQLYMLDNVKRFLVDKAELGEYFSRKSLNKHRNLFVDDGEKVTVANMFEYTDAWIKSGELEHLPLPKDKRQGNFQEYLHPAKGF